MTTAALVKPGKLDVVGLIGVAVGEDPGVFDPPGALVEIVPLDEAVEPPVGRAMVESVLDGQYVVVYVEVKVVVPVVQTVVTVAVMVVLVVVAVPEVVPVVDTEVVLDLVPELELEVELEVDAVVETVELDDAEVVEVLEVDDEVDEIGVQFGRVKVPLPGPP